VIAALELDRRVRLAGQSAAYLAVSVPIALLAIVAVVVLMIGAAVSITGIGAPLLLGAAAAVRRIVRLDRHAANRFLGTQIPPLPSFARTSGSPWRRSREVLSDRNLWRSVALLATKPFLTAAMVAVVAVPLLLLAGFVQFGVQGVGGLGDLDYVGPWSLGPGLGVVMLLLALPAAVLVVATLEALEPLLCVIATTLLAPRAQSGGPVRELLAESLGDRSVSIAYWLPDREIFVDEVGRPVMLPEPMSGRAWTAVERDGRRVAAIVHDAALDTSRELVTAAAAASSMAIDNERLKADLRARLEELRESRLRIVAATDEARRRIERDLHDGAQQQLVALALELRLLKARLKDPEAIPLVDQLSERLDSALAELRELARGIHPSILTDRGLAPAVLSLADRASLPVEYEVAVQERLPAPVESAAYFLVAEALTNVAKYAHATHVTVDIRRDGDELVVLVSDDGIGGVDLDHGSGLRGLMDRLAAVDGTLTIESPPGVGTRLLARIPVAPGAGA
jgi:signal transduction histidine kinase